MANNYFIINEKSSCELVEYDLAIKLILFTTHDLEVNVYVKAMKIQSNHKIWH